MYTHKFFYLYFLLILQNYTTVLKFIRFDHQPPWPTAVGGLTAVAHSCDNPPKKILYYHLNQSTLVIKC
jgi:hypothetical protein